MSKHRYGSRQPVIGGPSTGIDTAGQRSGLTPVMRWILASTEDQDAAKRIEDQYNLHIAVNREHAIGQYFAVSLQDGRGDNTLYPTKRDAAAHQSHPDRYAYFRIVLGGIDRKDALIFLQFCREQYRQGLRLTDPEDARTQRNRGGYG